MILQNLQVLQELEVLLKLEVLQELQVLHKPAGRSDSGPRKIENQHAATATNAF